MLSDFYGAFAPLTFTVFGLWLVVVQTRHADWSRSPEHRRRAYAVSLHFAIPGLMSLLSLVDPSDKTLWRVAFGVSATGGAVTLAYLGLPSVPTPGGRWWRLASGLSVLLYVLVVLVAVGPGVAKDLGAPLRIEAVLLSLIVFLGINVAWALMFDDVAVHERA